MSTNVMSTVKRCVYAIRPLLVIAGVAEWMVVAWKTEARWPGDGFFWTFIVPWIAIIIAAGILLAIMVVQHRWEFYPAASTVEPEEQSHV